jgi:hypothetical protein
MLINKIMDNFTKIPNALIVDKRLSASAKVIYCYLASKPTGWTVYNLDIQNQLCIKRSETLSKYWKELIDAGWIERYKNTDKDFCKIGVYVYTIFSNTEKAEYIKNRTHNNKETISKKEEHTREPLKEQSSINTYEGFLSLLKEAVKYKTKVTINKRIGKKLYDSIEDKKKLFDDYVAHQLDKQNYAVRITSFMEDYNTVYSAGANAGATKRTQGGYSI